MAHILYEEKPGNPDIGHSYRNITASLNDCFRAVMVTKNGLGYTSGDFFHNLIWSPWSKHWLGPERACKVRALVGLGLLRAWPGLVGRLGVLPAGLAQKPGPRGLGLLGYVVKAWARARSGPNIDPKKTGSWSVVALCCMTNAKYIFKNPEIDY
jgi:hypothetical protein